MDGVGNVYVVGGTHGSLPGQISSGQAHVFVREYDADGQEVWTRQIGTSELDVRGDVAVDRTGNVYMAGHTLGALPGQTHLGGGDVFVRKYDPDGQEVWTRQFGTSEVDVLGDVAVDGSGNLYVAGHTRGALPGQTSLGESDIFVRKYDADGQEVWTRQFGTSTSGAPSSMHTIGQGPLSWTKTAPFASTWTRAPATSRSGGWRPSSRAVRGEYRESRVFTDVSESSVVGPFDSANGVAIDGAGNVYVTGQTEGALTGQTHLGGGDVFVRKYDADGEEVWTRQFGTPKFDSANDIAVDGAGNVYVAGHTAGALPGQTSLELSDIFPPSDIFVRKYDTDGQEVWTRQFGTFTSDHASGVAMDGAGNVYVVGGTHGALPDQASLGESDVFVRQYDADGQEVWTRQFGTSSIDVASGVAMDGAGNVYVAGHTQGALPGQTSLGGGDDVFLIKLSSLSRPIPTPMPHGPSH